MHPMTQGCVEAQAVQFYGLYVWGMILKTGLSINLAFHTYSSCGPDISSGVWRASEKATSVDMSCMQTGYVPVRVGYSA